MPSVSEMQALLAQVTEDFAQRSVDAWRPAFGLSPGQREADDAAVLLRNDGVTPWGSAPLEVVWKACELLYAATLEYTRATAGLMAPPFRTWAPATEARSAVEAAAQAFWLFDLQVKTGRKRVGRYTAMRLYAAHRLEYTYDEVKPTGRLEEFGTPPADIEAQAALLGLTPILNKNNEVIGYEDEQAKKIDKLVQDLVGGNNAYSVLSGAAHSEFWSLLGGYQGRPPTPAGLSPDEHESDPESFVPLVRACLQALFKPIDLACEMFDRGALAKDLDRIYKRAVGVMGYDLSPDGYVGGRVRQGFHVGHGTACDEARVSVFSASRCQMGYSALTTNRRPGRTETMCDSRKPPITGLDRTSYRSAGRVTRP